ncbi:NAD(P)-binding oxidoreductase [Kribbella qitaiheensis]|uniref:NAD(P)-dependent oxidoreductase n=1 Tax=Kribbella qitaiheensis TaxID=1544730 RepID=UPI0019D64CB0
MCAILPRSGSREGAGRGGLRDRPSGRKASGLYSDAARALVAALEATAGARLIAITSAGVRRDDPNFKLSYRVLASTLMKEAYDDRRLMESIVRVSSLDWTFVRPTRLLDDPPTGTCRVLDGQTPEGGWQVTRTDVRPLHHRGDREPPVDTRRSNPRRVGPVGSGVPRGDLLPRR